MATRTSAAGRPAPEPPRAIPFRRTASAARITAVGSGGPTPPLCDITRKSCSLRISSSVSRVSLPCPTWVVSPYTAAPEVRASATSARPAAICARASSDRFTGAPSTTASRSSIASGPSVILTAAMRGLLRLGPPHGQSCPCGPGRNDPRRVERLPYSPQEGDEGDHNVPGREPCFASTYPTKRGPLPSPGSTISI